jgi:hypothetical protein
MEKQEKKQKVWMKDALRWLAPPYVDFSGTLFFDDFHYTQSVLIRNAAKSH